MEVKYDLIGQDLNNDGDTEDTNEEASFSSYDNTVEAKKWSSVFGTNNPDATMPDDSEIDAGENPTEDYYTDGDVTEFLGGEEFLDGFGGEAIKSPFQDGHYIYTVIGGAGSGTSSQAPIIFVADLESPSSFWKKLQP